jgi:CheY-like chemotaxis protein
VNAPLAGKRCLVLDDEFLIAMDIQQLLESAGATVVCASNAQNALAICASEPPFDVAVLDVKLSDGRASKNHAATSAGVAAHLAKQAIPFVFLTGMAPRDIPALLFPDAPVVEKPYSSDALLDAVARALETRR